MARQIDAASQQIFCCDAKAAKFHPDTANDSNR
jgi:hypothetical protein